MPKNHFKNKEGEISHNMLKNKKIYRNIPQYSFLRTNLEKKKNHSDVATYSDVEFECFTYIFNREIF